MSEDRTQSPSKRRREMARGRGQAAHSRELTGAAGLLAAAAVLAVWGGGLGASLLAAVRQPLSDPMPVSADAAEVVDRLRHLALGVARPLLLVIGSAAAASLAAHQAQVRGLWAPGLLAPDPTRLWAAGGGPGLADRASRGAWSLAKSIVVAAAAAWAIRSDWASYQRLGALDAPDLALATGAALARLALELAAAVLALGLVDFALQHARFEAAMRTTPDESREELRSTEGDPALRASRRRTARSWWGDPAEALAGATLVVTGGSGLTVVLAGGPPPRPVSVRSVASGAQGDPLRRAAASAGVAAVSAPDLARRLARRRPPGPPPSPGLLAEVAALWPAAAR